MSLKTKLKNIKNQLLNIRKKSNQFLTCKEIEKMIINDEDIPTFIFSAKKKDYIVKSRNIYGSKQKRKTLKIK